MNVIDISIPMLRERGDDILLLINYFVNKFCREMERKPPVFSDNTLEVMKNYTWHGNVRELENLIQRLMVIVDSDTIQPADLPESMRFTAGYHRDFNKKLDDVISEHISGVLAKVGGNKKLAAEILGIDRKTLRTRLKKNQNFQN